MARPCTAWHLVLAPRPCLSVLSWLGEDLSDSNLTLPETGSEKAGDACLGQRAMLNLRLPLQVEPQVGTRITHP